MAGNYGERGHRQAAGPRISAVGLCLWGRWWGGWRGVGVVVWWVADEEGVGVTACLHRDQAAQVDQSRAAHTKHGGTKGEKANVARGGGGVG